MKDGYSICFNEWALDKNIKNELGLLLIISSLCAEKGYCYANNTYLANIFDIDEVSISRKLKKLINKNYITIDYKKSGSVIISREIRLTKMLTAVNKNVKDNNINNNINNMNIIYNWENNEKCECITEKNDICKRRSSYNINGKNYCNQHSKYIIGKSFKNKKESKKIYGEYKRIKLTDKEYNKLINDFGEEKLKEQIKYLDEYIESNNNKNGYTNFNLVIRKSFRENWFNKNNNNQEERKLYQDEDGAFHF